MNLDKDPESWARASPGAIEPSQLPNVLLMAIRDIGKLHTEILRLRNALHPFAEPHAMGDNYVKFAPRLIEAARDALR